MTKAPAPVKEIGYASTATSYNWTVEGETTPELMWPQSVEVYDAMRRTDSQVKSVLQAVTLPVQATAWRIDPAGARPEVVEFIADDMGLPIKGQSPKVLPRTKDRFSWAEHLRLALLMLPFGFSYFEQTYRVDPDGSRAHLHKLGQRPARTIQTVDVARDGGLISITQSGVLTNSGPQMPIPVSRLVAYVNEKEGGNWLGQSILRPAYKNWLLKDRLLRVQAQTIERNGMGVPLYEAAETETDLTAGLGMATSWRAGEAAGSAIPFGAKLRLVGVEGDLPDAEPAIRYHDEQIARAVLAHFLNLGTQTGSWALGTTFADFFTLSLQTLAQQIADTATQHIIEDLVDINFGESEPAPRLVFDEIGSRQRATAQAIKGLVDSGALHPDEVLEESTRQQFGLPPADPDTAFTAPADVVQDGSQPPAPKVPSVRPGSVAAAGDANPKAPTLDPFGGVGRETLRRRARALGIELRRGASRDEIMAKLRTPVVARFDPTQPRDPHSGEWSLGGAVKDLLKLVGRIDLDDDETLIGSGKVDADSGGARAAVTRLADGTASWRVGFGGEGYGQRNRDNGTPAWDGNPTGAPMSKDERARLDTDLEALDDEYDTASAKRQAEIEQRQDDIREQLTAGEGEFNQTAKLDEYSVDRLSTLTAAALAEAVEQDKIEDAAWDEIERLEAQRESMRGMPTKWTPEQEARWDDLTEQIETQQRVARAAPDAPGYGGIVFAQGVIPGSAWGDIHYSVELDEPSSAGDYAGPYVMVGVTPKGDPDWVTGRDWQGKFPVSEWRKVLRQIEDLRSATSAS